MKKEVFFAIILGLVLGLIVTYGVYRARQSMLRTPSVTIDPTATPEASGAIHNSLTLHAPEDETIQTTKELRVTGTTESQATVVVFVNEKESIITADNSGNFSLQVELVPGSNVIHVHAIDEDGNVAENERTVIFFSGSLEDAPTASESATTATSAAKPKTTPKPATSSGTRR